MSNLLETAPYEPGVYMLTGVNGTGKSTIVEAIAADHPEVMPVHASQELRLLFNGVSREELEQLSAEEKLARMVTRFTTIFDDALAGDRAVMLDTHLLVPIRKDDELVYENIWSNAYGPYTRSVAMLTADPFDVRDWRMADELESGRKRNTSVLDIEADQTANVIAFESLKASGAFPEGAQAVHNADGLIESTRLAVERVFRAS